MGSVYESHVVCLSLIIDFIYFIGYRLLSCWQDRSICLQTFYLEPF